MSDTEVHGECCLGYHLNILHIFIKFKKILWESITITFGNLTHSLPELQQSGAPCVCVRVQRESSQCAQQERAISKSIVVICSYVANPLAIYLNKALCGTTDFRLKVCGECEGQ